MPLSNYNRQCFIGIPGCNCIADGIDREGGVPTGRRSTPTRATNINRPASTITMRASSDWAAEAYTYSAEQIRGLIEWLPSPLTPISWLTPTEAGDRALAVANQGIRRYRVTWWRESWYKLWRQVGAAHEAKIFCKEVTYKDGELLIR